VEERLAPRKFSSELGLAHARQASIKETRPPEQAASLHTSGFGFFGADRVVAASLGMA
jgi:hypothetical protein